jgi:hypothetical protein
MKYFPGTQPHAEETRFAVVDLEECALGHLELRRAAAEKLRGNGRRPAVRGVPAHVSNKIRETKQIKNKNKSKVVVVSDNANPPSLSFRYECAAPPPLLH